MATEYIIDNARRAFPFLVHFAKKREVVTYGDLGKLIGVHHRVVPHVLGYIRDKICIGNNLPLLNTIVVNKGTQMAGHSFLPSGTGNLSKNEYRSKFEDFRDEVFFYKKWDAVLKEIGLKPIKESQEDLDKIGRAYTEIMKRYGGKGESIGHLKLKKHIARNPKSIGISARREGIQEYLFISGDECDVVFDFGAQGAVVVEIKNGEKGELVKGIYQAIKYRALMIAERGKGRKYPVRAFLVAYEMPASVIKKAKNFGIECYAISRAEIS